MAQTSVKLKLLIDSKAQKVLFAEADKNLIDFLFNLLSLPLGTVIRLPTKKNMVGCLGNLYESVETLNDTYMQPNQNKDTILKPRVSFCSDLPMLLPNIESKTEGKFYLCYNHQNYNDCCRYVADDPKALCPRCKNIMNQEITYVQAPNASASTVATNGLGSGGGYVKGVVTYMVMDDLSVKPMSTISSITLLNKFNIKEVGVLEEKVVSLDVNEGVKLLKASLTSNTVLTDLFLRKKVTT